MATLYPAHDYLLIERDEEPTKTPGGILLPDSAKTKTNRGTVKAAGDGRWQDGKFIEVRIKPGQVVIFGAYTGHDVKVEDKEYLLVQEKDVLAVIK